MSSMRSSLFPLSGDTPKPSVGLRGLKYSRPAAAAGGLLLLGSLIAGCASSDSGASPSPSPTLTSAESPTATGSPTASKSTAVVPTVPSVTLSPPPPPARDPGIATSSPIVLKQWLPPDITSSGIALAVSSTKYKPGRQVLFAAQAAPELAGFTSYLLQVGPGGAVSVQAMGTVDPKGRFTLGFKPAGSVRIVATVAEAGVTTNQPQSLDEMAARSAVVAIKPA